MRVWNIESIETLPNKSLDAWTAFEVPFNGVGKPWTLHFIGFERGSCKGQVSSPVLAFDPAKRLGRTQGGAIYHLTGRPGGNSDAIYMWNFFKHSHHILDERNVTDEVLEVLCNGTDDPHSSGAI